MNYLNTLFMKFDSLSANEGFARSAVAAFCVQLNPTLDDITDIKTAVSEAVTNCVVHAYPNSVGKIEIFVGLGKDFVDIEISDQGVGIENLEEARQPFFTTKPNEERAGMGFTVMESFMTNLVLSHITGGGLKVFMTKKLQSKTLMATKTQNG